MKTLKKLTIPWIVNKYRDVPEYRDLFLNIDIFNLNDINDIQLQKINQDYYIFFTSNTSIYKWGPLDKLQEILLLKDILRFYNIDNYYNRLQNEG